MQRALDFLKAHNEIALATCEGNRPKLRLFQIMKQEGTHLFFSTSPEKAVYRQLLENPNIEVLATDNRISVRCEGSVNFDVSDDVKRWIYDNNPVLPRLYTSYDKLVYFRMPVEHLEYFDLRPTPPEVLHYESNTDTVEGGFAGERFGTYKA